MNYTFIKKNILGLALIAGFVLIPFAAQAQYSYDYGGYDYGGYDYGGYDYSYDNGGYDYSYDNGGYDYSYDNGGYDYTYDYGNYDYTYDYGNYDYTYDYGNYDYTYDYGNYDYTYDYGNYDYTYDYGNYDGVSYGDEDYYSDVDYYTDQPYYSSGSVDYYENYSYPQYSYNYGSSCSGSRCGNSNSTQDIIVNNTNVNNNNNEVIIIDEDDNDDDDDTDNDDTLDVECIVSDTSVEEGDTVTFTADVSGGRSPYTYDWNGDINSSSRVVSVRFNDEGEYDASITVRDDRGRTASDTCPSVVVDEEENNDDDDLEVQCEVSDTSVEDGDYVTVSVEIDGGNSPFEIRWDGDTEDFDDFDDEDESQRVRVDTNSSRIELEVTVEDDDGNEESDTCTIRVDDEDDDDDDNDVRVLTNNDGDLAGLSSVFLSQVPYTGSEDVLVTIGFIVGLLIWSSIIATVLLRKKNRKEISSKAQAFKEANRLQKISN